MDKPRVQALIARWGICDWETRCIDSDDVPLWLEFGWLNYMRDPFDLDHEAQWKILAEADAAWEAYLKMQPPKKRKWYEAP